MYTLFLTLRYLTRKAIVIFPILVVALCVMMLIIVNSIMGGFVDRVRQAGRGLMGDLVVGTPSMGGFPYYQEFQKVLAGMPEIEASTPVIRSYGLLNLPERRANTGVQIVGIDPVGKSLVSRFRDGLFRQYQAPAQALESLKAYLPATGMELAQKAATRVHEAREAEKEPNARLVSFYDRADRSSDAALTLYQRLRDRADLVEQARVEAERTEWLARRLPPLERFAGEGELAKALVPAEPSFAPPPEALGGLNEGAGRQGCIVGVDLGLFRRDRRGNYQRSRDYDFLTAVLTVVPITAQGSVTRQPQSQAFTIVDDSNTKVFDVDSTYVYAPFETVQKMTFMHEQQLESGGTRPARCHDLQIKVRGADEPGHLLAVGAKVEKALKAFSVEHPELQLTRVDVQTWEQKQQRYISAVQNEKNMITFILSLMSLVVLVVIFLIFYMIVRDKTRDIGIIKAVGGTSAGVTAIFMAYGVFIGAVGGLIGLLGGIQFVHHTNEIHEWIYQVTGFLLWDRRVYLFDRIPDQINPREVTIFVLSALVAGLLGAAIPAVLAGRKDPVSALRYE